MTDRLPYATVRKSNHWLWFLLLPLFLLLAACPQHYRWNQKLTITVDTPDGPVVASVVQRIDVSYIPQWMRVVGGEIQTELRGEGLAVDLGGGRILLSMVGQGAMTERVFDDVDRRPQVFAAIEDQVGQPPRQIPFDLMPPFVSLPDITDPSTASRLLGNDVPRVFGEGYRIRDMKLEITDEPVTTGQVEAIVGKEFFWRLNELQKQRTSDVIAGKADRAFFLTIGRSHFIRDLK